MASNNTRQPSQRRRSNRKQQGTMSWGPSPNTNQGTVSWRSSPNTNINDKRAHTMKCLTDVFHENFDIKVIQSVAESCNFDSKYDLILFLFKDIHDSHNLGAK